MALLKLRLVQSRVQCSTTKLSPLNALAAKKEPPLILGMTIATYGCVESIVEVGFISVVADSA